MDCEVSTRLCCIVHNKTISESSKESEVAVWCAEERKPTVSNPYCCQWVERFEIPYCEVDLKDAIFYSMQSGFNPAVSETQKPAIQLNNMIGLFENPLNTTSLIIKSNDIQLARFILKCRSFQTILSDITPLGNGMRVSYHTEPKIRIKQSLMMTIRKNNRVEPANRRFVAGVGYSNNLSPIICLHKDFLLDVVLAFYIPRHGTDGNGMAIELLLKVNDDIYSLFSHGSAHNAPPIHRNVTLPVGSEGLASSSTFDTTSRASSMDTHSVPGMLHLCACNANKRDTNVMFSFVFATASKYQSLHE
eukprot:534541_1